MASSVVWVNALPVETALGLRLNNRDIEVQLMTKLSGDSTATVLPQYLSFVQTVYVFTGNIVGATALTQDTAVTAAITNTPGSQSIALTTLTTGADTVNGFIILVGIAAAIHPA